MTADFTMHKPMTPWQRRKKRIGEAWALFKESKVGLVGIGILFVLVILALISMVLL